MNTLRDQLTAALRLECAVADGKMELHRGAGPGGVDLYAPKGEHVSRYQPRVSNKAASPGCGPCVDPCVGCSTGAMVKAATLPSKPVVRFRGPLRPPIKGRL